MVEYTMTKTNEAAKEVEALDDDGLLFCNKKNKRAYVWGNAGWLICGACKKPLDKNLFHKETI